MDRRKYTSVCSDNDAGILLKSSCEENLLTVRSERIQIEKNLLGEVIGVPVKKRTVPGTLSAMHGIIAKHWSDQLTSH